MGMFTVLNFSSVTCQNLQIIYFKSEQFNLMLIIPQHSYFKSVLENPLFALWLKKYFKCFLVRNEWNHTKIHCQVFFQLEITGTGLHVMQTIKNTWWMHSFNQNVFKMYHVPCRDNKMKNHNKAYSERAHNVIVSATACSHLLLSFLPLLPSFLCIHTNVLFSQNPVIWFYLLFSTLCCNLQLWIQWIQIIYSCYFLLFRPLRCGNSGTSKKDGISLQQFPTLQIPGWSCQIQVGGLNSKAMWWYLGTCH